MRSFPNCCLILQGVAGHEVGGSQWRTRARKISRYFTDPNLYRFESFTLKACSELDKDLEKELAEAASEYEWDYFDSKSRYESSFEWPEYVYCLSGLDYYDGTVLDLWRQAEHAGLNACEFEHFYLGAALEVHDEEGTP